MDNMDKMNDIDEMRILSLETATHFGGVACMGPAGERSDGPWASRASSLEVLAAAERLLAECGVAREALDLVAVSTGPGLFTGVRVGLSIAKTLVWAQGPDGPTRLVAVPTLDAVAALAVGQPGVEPGDLIAAMTDARRGEVYAALFAVGDGADEPHGTYRTYTPHTTYTTNDPNATPGLNAPSGPNAAHSSVATPMGLVRLAEDLVERPAEALRLLLAEATTVKQAGRPHHNDCGAGVSPANCDAGVPPANCGAGVSPATLHLPTLLDRPIHLIGDGAERYAEVLAEVLGSRARACDHRAGNLPLAVARLGLLRAQRGETAPPEAVHPHYVRRPDAVPPTIE